MRGALDQFQISSSHFDFYLCLKKWDTSELVVGRSLLEGHKTGPGECFLDRNGSTRHVAFRQLDERQARLSIPSGLMSCHQGLFSTLNIALAKANAPQLSERPTKLPAQVWTQFLA